MADPSELGIKSMRLSIGIATWNRADLLATTLDSIGDLLLPADVTTELIVCDNNSNDTTQITVLKASERMNENLEIRYLFEKRQGKSYALNRIIEETSGDWLLFLDDDVTVERGLVMAYQDGIERYPEAVCFGGPILARTTGSARGRMAFLLKEYPAVYGLMPTCEDMRISPPDISPWGANMCIRRDAIPSSGFETDRGMSANTRIAGEDVSMVMRVLGQEREGWLLKDAKVYHWIPQRPSGTLRFCAWHMGFGRSWVLDRGKATPGKFGVPWWAWREFLHRAWRAAIQWRPWPRKVFYDALKDASQYLGYLLASHSSTKQD